MQELIERLEKATGPDRELDGLIYGSLRGLKRNGGTFHIYLSEETFQFEHPTVRHTNGPAALYVRGCNVGEFTESIDAALTLVPDGWLWDVASSGAAWVMPDYELDGQIVIGGVQQPAIALCIAALKARLAVAAVKPHNCKID